MAAHLSRRALAGAMAGAILAGCAPQGPHQPAAHPTPPPHLRSRGASIDPSLRPALEDLSIPAAFSYTDSEGEASDCIFYATADAPAGLVVYVAGAGAASHSQGEQPPSE